MLDTGWSVLLVLLMMLPVVVITTVMPLLTRKIESFGVTIPEEKQRDKTISALRRQYLWLSGGIGAAATISLIVLSSGEADEQRWSMLLLWHLIIYMAVTFALYLKQHYAVKRLKREQGWNTSAVQRVVVNTKFRSEKLVYSYWWFAPHALLIIGTVLAGVLGYESMPDQIPMKYDMAGEITRVVDKTPIAVLWPSILQAFMLLVFVFVNYAIGRSKQVVEASDLEGSLRRNIRFRRIWSAYAIGMGFIMIALFASITIGLILEWPSSVNTILPLILVGVILAGTIVLSFVTGQGGSRLKSSGEAKGQAVATADQDQYWKLGQIYINPSDPAIFVEKRFGIGWTMNFGSPLSWIIIVAIVSIPILIAIFIEN